MSARVHLNSNPMHPTSHGARIAPISRRPSSQMLLAAVRDLETLGALTPFEATLARKRIGRSL